MSRYLGIDVGGTYIKYGIYNIEGVEISSGEKKTKSETLDQFIDSLVKIIDENNDVDGIGISLPGFVDVNSGLILDGGAITVLEGQNIKEIILDRCNKEIDVENDANCVALAEKWIGNGEKYSDFITITIGTGIGGGIIINDKLYRGNRFMAGEFGYMITGGVKNNNPQKSTSSFTASTFMLVQNVAKAKNIEYKDLNGKMVFDMIENNDEEVIEVYNKWIENLSLLVYNLVYTLNPEAILIGGGVSSQSRIIEDIKTKIDEFDERTSKFVHIQSCKFNNDSGKIGAIYNHLVNKQKI